jgi:hypothetical protein
VSSVVKRVYSGTRPYASRRVSSGWDGDFVRVSMTLMLKLPRR